MSVVQALIDSTKAYLAWLDEQQQVTVLGHIREIVVMPESMIIEGVSWAKQAGRTTPGTKLTLDSPLLLRTSNSEYEIRLTAHDRPTGNLEFVSMETIEDGFGSLVVSFRWLVQRVLNWLEHRGKCITWPPRATTRPPPDLDRIPDADDEKYEAGRVILNSPLSYIWGPPGTGKTSHVLAPVVKACAKAGEKVLVLAPTNLAVDNALDAVLRLTQDSSTVLRLGIPTSGFLERWPECCESKAHREQLAEIEEQIEYVRSRKALLEDQVGRLARLVAAEAERNRKAYELQSQVERCQVLAARQQGLKTESSSVKSQIDQLAAEAANLQSRLMDCGLPRLETEAAAMEKEHISLIEKLHGLKIAFSPLRWYHQFTSQRSIITIQQEKTQSRLEVVEQTLTRVRRDLSQTRVLAQPIEQRLKFVSDEMNHMKIQLEELDRDRTLTESEFNRLNSMITELSHEVSRLDHVVQKHQREAVENPVGVELDQELAESSVKLTQLESEKSRFRQDLGLKSVLGMTLDGFIGMTMEAGQLSVDRIFVDEAAYAPLAKVLPLLSMNCPIALLGDHRQLPPVCENKNDPKITSFWQMSAIFIETAFNCEGDHNLIVAANEPTHEQAAKYVLTRSYRFGSNLASLLDRSVYGNVGLTGRNEQTRIAVESCSPRLMPNEQVRRNLAEAEAIVAKVQAWLSWPNPNGETLAILTPYKAQARLIASLLQNAGINADGIDVLNVHKAQGREWDWVLISVVDTDRLSRNRPWFTDDTNDRTNGREVLNTAISRAKKHLFLFMDADFWKHRSDPSLILSQIARSSG